MGKIKVPVETKRLMPTLKRLKQRAPQLLRKTKGVKFPSLPARRAVTK